LFSLEAGGELTGVRRGEIGRDFGLDDRGLAAAGHGKQMLQGGILSHFPPAERALPHYRQRPVPSRKTGRKKKRRVLRNTW